MLNLIKKPRRAGHSIPSHLTTLSVSWLNNQFKAVAIHRGEVASTWERPGEADGTGNFETFVREAVQQTGYRGQTVSLVLAHPRLMQQLLDVPPAKGTALQKIIQRQAQQQKMFSGEAAWASQMLPSGKGTQRILLHLLPRLLLGQLVQGCKRNGLHLTAVLPPSAVLHNQLTQLPLEKEEVALLAAETGGATTAVVGRSDGQMLLARTLPGSWTAEAGRVALDLNRTILFVNQQYGVPASQSAWLFGPGAQEHRQVVQDLIQCPVKVSPVDYDPFYWPTEAAKLPPELAPNFISAELQKAPQRRVIAKVVAAATVLLVAGCVATAVYAHLQAGRDRETIRNASEQIAELEARQRDLQRFDAELSRKQQVVKLVVGERPPPATAWVLAYLSDAVPSDLVITNLVIMREDEVWKLKLAGTLQQAIKTPEASQLEESVQVLKTRLSGAPFYIQFLDDAEKSEQRTADRSLPGWLSRLANVIPERLQVARPRTQDHFILEGVMR